MTSKRLSMLVAAMAALASFSPHASADILGFNNGNGFTTHGGATISGNVLTTTDGGLNETRDAFFDTPQNISSFDASFIYQATDPSGACFCDGLAFILQDDPRGANAVGFPGVGGDFGYTTITPSAAIEFGPSNDPVGQFHNPGAPGTNFYTDGRTPQIGGSPLLHTGAVNVGSMDPILVNVFYNGVLTETLTDEVTHATFTIDYGKIDLPAILGGSSKAFIGFSAASGAGGAKQTISDFTFVPEPGTFGLLIPAIGCFWLLRRKHAKLA